MNRSHLCVALVGIFLASVCTAAEEKIYKMCVPQKYYEDCLTLLKDPSEAGIQMECVAGRDRIDCIDLINQQKADVLASEPEDMYVAYHKKNADYRVISEIRTKEDKDANFRYEGVILVKKNSNIHSLQELRGAKSCHTGFGRNVGFKIPVTKLKNANILKVSMDPEVTATERELKALSEFFAQSCLVGTYSPYPEVDRLLKKKYANLCALCENPEQCNYPDKYSGYDGAIRCLDKGKGDVAFTKVQFIKKYFGLLADTKAEGDPADFEYLCEDGSRRPLTEPACSWAQRPWSGYISNTKTVKGDEKLHNLQNRLQKFFENGLHAKNKEAAAHLLINENAVYHAKPQAVEPKEYLEKPGYKDVIERDGSAIKKIKLCVQNDVELAKCNALRNAAYSRDIRPEIECLQKTDCALSIKNKEADIAVAKAEEYQNYRDNKLKPIAFEKYEDNNVLVAVVKPRLDKETLEKTQIKFNDKCGRARKAAAFLNKKRGLDACLTKSDPTGQIEIVSAKELEKYKNDLLLCSNLEQKPVTEFRTCNVDMTLPNGVFINEDLSAVEQDTVKHLLISLSDKFGTYGKLADVFTLFGEFEKGKKHVIFHDDAITLTTEEADAKAKEENYKSLTCDKQEINSNDIKNMGK